MHIEYKDLDAAEKANIINSQQKEKLWSFWTKNRNETAHFQLTHIMYYFGGLLAISAVTLFFTQAWDKLVGLPLFILSTLFFILGLFLIHFFQKKRLLIPAGIMATFSLVIVPLAVYNVQLWLGYRPPETFYYAGYHTWISSYWISMEVSTLLIGLGMLYLYRFSFLLFPISITLWYLSMDLVPLLFHMKQYLFQERATFSLFYGLFLLAVTIYMDVKLKNKQQDYTFWLYIVSVLTFWGGLSCQEPQGELSRFFYCLINIVMIFSSIYFNRRVFAIFGVMGVLGYLGHLSFSVFKDSLGFPIALVILGLIIILIATRWQRMEIVLRNRFQPYIPSAFLNRK